MKYLSIESSLYQFCVTFYHFFILNLLWSLFSLPIFTVGASTTALFFVLGKMYRKESINPIKDFLTSFKTNFRQATLWWILTALLLVILKLNTNYVSEIGEMKKIVLPVQFIFFIELIIINFYIYPILSRFHITNKNLLKASVYFAHRYLFKTITVLLTIIGFSYLASAFNIISLILVSCIGYLIIVFFSPIFKENLRKT